MGLVEVEAQMKLTLVILAAVSLCGCSTTNISKLVQALGKDTNAVQIVVSSPWGTVTVNRNMRQQIP